MSGGGKGGSQSSKVEIPPWLENATKANLARAEQAAQIGYMPYYGPDVAAITPTQQLGMQSSMDAAAAFGLAPRGADVMAGMPHAQVFTGVGANEGNPLGMNVRGYSSQPLYQQALDELQARDPEQMQRYQALFSNQEQNQYIPEWARGF